MTETRTRVEARRAVVAGLAVWPLAGCFRPMLAEGSAAAGLRGRIALPAIEGRFGYHMVKRLENRLGKPAETAWQLEVITSLEEQGLAIEQDNSVTRITLKARADWSLFADGASTPVLREAAYSQSGYNSTTSLFATRQTRRDVERRLAIDLGERIARVILARADRIAGT